MRACVCLCTSACGRACVRVGDVRVGWVGVGVWLYVWPSCGARAGTMTVSMGPIPRHAPCVTSRRTWS